MEDISKYIKDNYNKVDWRSISAHPMPESVITQYGDKLDWQIISRHQRLSESFILSNADRLDWQIISLTQNLTDKVLKENILRVTEYVLSNVCYQRMGFVNNGERVLITPLQDKKIKRAKEHLAKKLKKGYNIGYKINRFFLAVVLLGWMLYIGAKDQISKTVQIIALVALICCSIASVGIMVYQRYKSLQRS